MQRVFPILVPAAHTEGEISFSMLVFIAAMVVCSSLLLALVYVVEVSTHVVVEAVLRVGSSDTDAIAAFSAHAHAVVVIRWAIIPDLRWVLVVDTNQVCVLADQAIVLGPCRRVGLAGR